MKPILLAACLIAGSFLFAQDTSKQKDWTFSKQIFVHARQQFYPVYGSIRMPEDIKTFRRWSQQLPVTYDTISDNPLRHGALYAQLKTKTAYRNRIFLYADLFAEHRGVSYGVFDTKNQVLYPVIRLEGNDTIRIFSEKLLVKGKAGQFLDERLGEGLMIYNIDVQGMQLELGIRNWYLQYTIYGDLNNGIGLDIDDLASYTAGRRWPGKGYLQLSWVTAPPPNFTLSNNQSIQLAARLEKKTTSFYVHLGHRFLPVTNFLFLPSIPEQSAGVIGMEFRHKSKKFRLTSNAEFRAYGNQFNILYLDNFLRYRDSAADFAGLYANSIGRYLYPLRKYETPFSQWAVFTEYSGYNIGGINLRADMTYFLHQKLSTGLNLDLNYLKGKKKEQFYQPPELPRTTSFFYPFFEWSLDYRPAPICMLSLVVGNKAMNLDVHYPTHYQLSKPVLGIRSVVNFE